MKNPRKPIHIPGTKIVLLELNDGHCTIFDMEDEPLIKKFCWTAGITANKIYAHRIGSNGRIGLSRFILGVTDRSLQVDHINGDPLDNRRCNLRICTLTQNAQNRSTKKGKRFKGVNPVYNNRNGTKKIHGYKAEIHCNKKRTYIGYFKTELEAAVAYNEAAKKLHGVFAKLNNITKGI